MDCPIKDQKDVIPVLFNLLYQHQGDSCPRWLIQWKPRNSDEANNGISLINMIQPISDPAINLTVFIEINKKIYWDSERASVIGWCIGKTNYSKFPLLFHNLSLEEKEKVKQRAEAISRSFPKKKKNPYLKENLEFLSNLR